MKQSVLLGCQKSQVQLIKLYSQNQMKPNAVSTPNTFGAGRARLLSFNTPQLSPLRIIQSPYMNIGEYSLFDNQLNFGGEFRLEEGAAVEENVELVQESSEESVEQIDFPRFPIDAKVTKDNMTEFLVDSIGVNEQRIAEVKELLDELNQPFVSEVFQYLYKRFKKVKKTKEEMIKYTMRKSFKYITDILKKEDPSLIPLLTTDGLEGMTIYFNKHCQDQQIFIPFKKNSLQKTMNTAFLKKVFSVYRFYRDYKRFLKTFQNQFLKDNKKKVATMNEAVKQCINTKCFKSLQNFKRLPWTKDILIKLKEFAIQLLTYSPYSKEGVARPLLRQGRSEGGSEQRLSSCKIELSLQNEVKPAPKRSIDSLNYDETYRDLINNDYQQNEKEEELMEVRKQKKMKKKSVIILTPPIHPINSPKIPDFALSLE